MGSKSDWKVRPCGRGMLMPIIPEASRWVEALSWLYRLVACLSAPARAMPSADDVPQPLAPIRVDGNIVHERFAVEVNR